MGVTGRFLRYLREAADPTEARQFIKESELSAAGRFVFTQAIDAFSSPSHARCAQFWGHFDVNLEQLHDDFSLPHL
jgi:hypothetical protein